MADPVWRYPSQEMLTEQTRRETANEIHEDKIIHTPKGDLHAHYVQKKNVYTIWQTEHPLKEIEDIDLFLSQDFSDLEVESSRMFEKQKQLGENGLILVTLDDPICAALDLFGMTNLLMYAMTERERIQYFLDALFEIILTRLRVFLKQDVRDIVFRICGPEVVTPPYLPFDFYPCFVTKYLKQLSREIKDAGGFVRLHSHGKVASVLDEIASTDVDAIDPIEPPPDGDITLSEVKKRYGNRFILFGNIELKELENRDPARIDALVRQAMEDAKEGGGFVLLPTATPINTPLSKRTEENFIQYLNSGLKYGAY